MIFLLITTWDKARSLNFTYWLFGSEFVVLYRNDKNCVKKLHVNHVTCSWLRIKTGDLNQFVFLGCVGWSLQTICQVSKIKVKEIFKAQISELQIWSVCALSTCSHHYKFFNTWNTTGTRGKNMMHNIIKTYTFEIYLNLMLKKKCQNRSSTH